MGKEQMLVIGGILGSLVLIIGGALVVNEMKFGGDPAKLLTKGRGVHWHAQFTASVCGQEQNMKTGGNGVMGSLHTHNDAQAHMEGVFKTADEITVKRYLQVAGVPVSDKGIFNKTDGSACSNEATTSARLYGKVNDQDVSTILDYPMHDNKKPADQVDKIRLIYE